MYLVDLYLTVRLACHVEELSQREAARRFGLSNTEASVDPVGTQAPPTRLRFAHAKRYAKPRGSLLCTTGTTRNNAFGIT